MELLYDENDKQDSENYRAGVTKACGSIRGPVCLFFCAEYDPDYFAASCYHTIYSGDKSRCYDCSVNLFPETNMQDFMVGIVNEVYNQSKTVIPITAIVALWSAGKGVLAVSTGLNCAYELRETRNYVFLRIRASIYTILFIAAIVMALVLSVFGNNISIFIYHKIPFLAETTDMIMRLRTVISFVVMTGISLLVYHFLPNRKLPFRDLILGSIFCSLGWLVISFVFSMYLTIFKGFSGLYGSMTAIILVMLWLYFCMYILLLGGEVNVILRDMEQE